MKQANPFLQKIVLNPASRLLMSSLLLAFLITSCTKKAADIAPVSNSGEVATARSPSSPSLQTVSLIVTVNNAGNKITSDASPDYSNGSQNVQAVIDRNGNFVFNTNTNSSKAAIRTLNFDFSSPITEYSTPPATNTSKSYTLETVASISTGITFIPLQNLGDGQSECVSFRAWGVTSNTINWRATFHAGFEDRDSSTTAFAYVTRNNATTWTITSLGNCLNAAIQNKAALRSGNAQTLYGYYNLPFSFTLTKL